MESIRTVGPNLKSFYYHVCKPSSEDMVKGVVLVLHGAEEHGARYESFGEELASQGYAMYAVDHIGHGKTTLGNKKELGKWTNKGKGNNFYLSAYNAYCLSDTIRRNHPGKPVYLLGCDFGGTMAQYIMSKFPNSFDGLIIAGSGVPTGRDRWSFVKCFIKKILFFDETKNKGMFKSRTKFWNTHFRPARTKYDWLNSKPEEVDKFIADPLTGFVGEIGYYFFLYWYINIIPTFLRFKRINKELPMMFVSGAEDYSTHKGKTTEKLMNLYNKKGYTKTMLKLYEGARHDVLLDCSKEQLAVDIANWINANHYNEEIVVVEKEQEVEYKAITIGEVKMEPHYEQDVSFEEEEPDDLKISNELKK